MPRVREQSHRVQPTLELIRVGGHGLTISAHLVMFPVLDQRPIVVATPAQIAKRWTIAVTVTHPEMSLLHVYLAYLGGSSTRIACPYTQRSGTLFVLEMGERVRVADVARELIRLSGLVPDKDILIQFSGIRPGGNCRKSWWATVWSTLNRHPSTRFYGSDQRACPRRPRREVRRLEELGIEVCNEDLLRELRVESSPV